MIRELVAVAGKSARIVRERIEDEEPLYVLEYESVTGDWKRHPLVGTTDKDIRVHVQRGGYHYATPEETKAWNAEQRSAW